MHHSVMTSQLMLTWILRMQNHYTIDTENPQAGANWRYAYTGGSFPDISMKLSRYCNSNSQVSYSSVSCPNCFVQIPCKTGCAALQDTRTMASLTSTVLLKSPVHPSLHSRPSAFRNSSNIPASATDSPRVSLNPLSSFPLIIDRKSLIS
ncbi:hypothetical protein AMURIS_01694 [Acetatifactor muris]|uniref:Uncharacterized protein n=1 Tax=Acetatifactor muris TaxID=879566 RepID=A0A2K4ZEV3_9FIRM|nr:hypothetical protein AMURIS_01694 [Acetatifactor muris]